MLAGVVIGVVLSLGWLVYVNARPTVTELGREPGTSAFRPLAQHPDDETVDGICVVRFEGGLYYVTAEVLDDQLREVVVTAETPVSQVVIDFGGVNFVDSQGSAEINRVISLAEAHGVGLHLARVNPDVRTVLAADGVEDRLGPDHFHANLDEAVAAATEAATVAPSSPNAETRHE